MEKIEINMILKGILELKDKQSMDVMIETLRSVLSAEIVTKDFDLKKKLFR